MLKEILPVTRKEKERDPDILGELQYCEDCNEVGESGIQCEYCIPPIEQLHTPIVAMINTQLITFFQKKKRHSKKHNKLDKCVNNAMTALSIRKKKNPTQRSIKNFMKTEDTGNQNIDR